VAAGDISTAPAASGRPDWCVSAPEKLAVISKSLWTLGLIVLSLTAFGQNPNAPCIAILPADPPAAAGADFETARQLLRTELAARGVDAALAPGIQEAREMGCNVALTLTLKRKDKPGLGSILRSAIPPAGPEPGASTYTRAPRSGNGSDSAPRRTQCRANEDVRLDIRATPLTLGESVVRRTFKARPAQDGADVFDSLIRQAAAVNW